MIKLIQSLKFENLSFSYETQDPLLKNVDFDFPMDTVNIIRGDRGAGRSTLLQILSGLQLPTQGHYLINDKKIDEMSFEDFLPYRLRIGYAFDLGGLISNRTLYDNLMLPLSYHKICPHEQAHEKVMHLMERFHLMKSKDMRPAHVSGSIRRVTCLIRAIILDPEVLLVDDPTVGLSKELQGLFADLLLELIDKKILHTLFISSFEESFISQFSYTNLFMDGGSVFLPEEGQKKVVSL